MSDRTEREKMLKERYRVPLTLHTVSKREYDRLHLYVDSLEETIEQLEAELKELRHE